MSNCDAVYAERDRCIALIAKLAIQQGMRAGIGQHIGAEWEDDWRNIIFIDLPTGQVSWHIHNSELPLFSFLSVYTGAWDGHSTDEKYNRIASYNAPVSLQEAPGSTEDVNVYSSMGKSPDRLSSAVFESLAQYAHDAWAAYMKYFLSRLPSDPKTGALLIDILYQHNLRTLIETTYDKLSEEAKELDRQEARCILEIIKNV